MVNKKTNSKKPVKGKAVKGKASAVKGIDPAVSRRILFSADTVPTFEELNNQLGPLPPLPPLPSVYDLDYGTNCDDLIKAGVFASIVSSGDGVNNKADCYISALQAYNYVARAFRVLFGMSNGDGDGFDGEEFKRLLLFLSDEDKEKINTIYQNLYDDIDNALNCLSQIAYNSTYNGSNGAAFGRLYEVEY